MVEGDDMRHQGENGLAVKMKMVSGTCDIYWHDKDRSGVKVTTLAMEEVGCWERGRDESDGWVRTSQVS